MSSTAAAQIVRTLPPPPDRAARIAHLRALEAESLYIIREVVAESARPVLLYSIGKDSSVVLHLARKAFAPAPLPMPLLHIDTGWNFREMIQFRDELVAQEGLDLKVHVNPDGVRLGLTPFNDSSRYTHVMNTEGLKQAFGHYRFDAALGGARRDEERSRAKERVFSFRSRDHRWDPRRQRPEFWRLYNGRVRDGESLRVFPLSNWTETDVWEYIELEQIPVVPLYFAAPRPVVRRGDALLLVDDDRFELAPGEQPTLESVRFRTLGCYPLTAATQSTATNIPEVLAEMRASRQSERQGRLIDADPSLSMERKKREGYF